MRQFAHALFWFRRDLRLTDNTGLYHALDRAQRVSCIFVFDREILDALPSKQDRRVEFIRESLAGIDGMLRRHGSTLTVLHGRPVEEVPELAARLKGERAGYAVFTQLQYKSRTRLSITGYCENRSRVACGMGDMWAVRIDGSR
jgi:deoxyribodipyrimidine photo-lyase